MDYSMDLEYHLESFYRRQSRHLWNLCVITCALRLWQCLPGEGREDLEDKSAWDQEPTPQMPEAVRQHFGGNGCSDLGRARRVGLGLWQGC